VADFKMTAAQAKKLLERVGILEKDNKALRKEMADGKKKPAAKKEEPEEKAKEKEADEEKPKRKGFLSFLD
jgi:hypothetical protein